MEKANKQLGQSAKGGLASLIQDSFCCGLILVDEAGKIQIVSAEASEALGLSEDLKGSDFHALPPEISELVDHARAGHGAGDDVQTRFQLQGCDSLCVAASVHTLSNGEPPAVVILLKYLTKAGSLEPDLRHLDRLATLGALSATTAHEVKNALVAIKSFVDLLLEKNRDQELAEVVESELNRIGSILERTQKLAGAGQSEFSQIRIEVVLGHVLRLLMPNFKRHLVKVVEDKAPSLPGLFGSEDALQQAFMNLFLNAMDAMPHGGTLTVRTNVVEPEAEGGNHGSRVRIEVCDTGAGVSPENLPRVFDPFFTTKPKGTGLGLSITRRIIEEHGGTIAVETQPGSGTCFRVLLPALEPGRQHSLKDRLPTPT